jgi:hypothetical protein
MKVKCQKKWLYLLYFKILIVLLCLSVYGQSQKQESFDSVPETLRARLTERLNMLIEYQGNKQWEKHYDLLSFRVVQDESKEAYVKRNQNWYNHVVPDDLILDFVPTETISHESSTESGWWTIYGCAKLRQKNRFVELRASVDAYRESDDWFFSTISVITPVDGNPELCTSPKSTSSQPRYFPTSTDADCSRNRSGRNR